MALAERADLVARLTLDGNFEAKLRANSAALGRFQGSIGKVGKGVGQLGAGLTRASVIVGGAVVAGLGAAAKAGAEFESQLNTINTIARATPEGLDEIGDGIRELARQGRGDLADLSAGFYDVLSAGITDAADAQKVLASASTLAIGGLSTNAEAVDLLTTAINAYGQEAGEAQKDADLFAKAIEIGKVKASEIAASFANVAPIAAQMGINIEEVAAAYGALTAQGTPAAEVTTQMSRAILDLLSPNKELLSLQKELKVNFRDLAEEKGLVVALQKMRDAVGDDDAAFKALFGRVEGYKFALQTTGPQQQIYNDALAAMADSAGTASEQMGERQKGLAYSVARLKANLVDAGLTLSSGFLPALSRTGDKLSAFLGQEGNRGQLKALGEDIGKAIDDIDWAAVLEGAKSFAGAMKGALDFALLLLKAVDKLPAELKAAGLGFLALNKLSGGLVGAGVGNIVGGLAGAGATGLAAKAPGLGKIFAQPVWVMNWPAGGLGGGVAGKGGIGGGLAAGAVAGVAGAVVVQGAFDAAKLIGGIDGVLKANQTGDAAAAATAMRSAFSETVLIPPLLKDIGLGLADGLDRAALAQRTAADKITTRVESMKGSMVDATQRAADRSTRAAERTRGAIWSATRNGQSAIVSAIQRNRPVVTVNVAVNQTRVMHRTYTTGQQLNRPSGPTEFDW